MEDAEHQQQFLKVCLLLLDCTHENAIYTSKVRTGQLGLIHVGILANTLFIYFF